MKSGAFPNPSSIRIFFTIHGPFPSVISLLYSSPLHAWLASCRRSFHPLTLPRFLVPKCFLFHYVCDTLLTQSPPFALSSLCPIFSLASCFESFPVFKVEVPFLHASAISNATSLRLFLVLPMYLYHDMLVTLHLSIYTLHRPSLNAVDFAASRRFQNRVWSAKWWRGPIRGAMIDRVRGAGVIDQAEPSRQPFARACGVFPGFLF